MKKPKFKVVTSDGSNIEFCPVLRIRGYTDGVVLEYKKPETGQCDVVAMHHDYRPLHRQGIYYVGKNTGNNSAAYLITLHRNGDGEAESFPGAAAVVGASSDPDCPGEDCSEIIRSNLYGVGLESISEKPHVNGRIIMIIIIGAVIVFVLMKSGILSKLFGG